MKYLGTAACPPYHLAFVIGGTSADACMKAVKLATAKELDGLPTKGNEHGQAFRDVDLEERLLQAAYKLGIGAQFGGKYSPTTCASSAFRAMAPPAPWEWLSRAPPTATSRQKSRRMGIRRRNGPQPRTLHSRKVPRQA